LAVTKKKCGAAKKRGEAIKDDQVNAMKQDAANKVSLLRSFSLKSKSMRKASATRPSVPSVRKWENSAEIRF